MLDAVKLHKSAGAYEELIELGKRYWRKGLADTEEGGIRLAVAKHPDITQRFLDGPKYPQWPYLSVLKQATGFGKQEDFQNHCINVAMRNNPAFAKQVRRGDFDVSPAQLVEKAAQERDRADPLPRGQTASEALLTVAKRYVAEGVPMGEAYSRAAYEHPRWYVQYRKESYGR